MRLDFLMSHLYTYITAGDERKKKVLSLVLKVWKEMMWDVGMFHNQEMLQKDSENYASHIKIILIFDTET